MKPQVRACPASAPLAVVAAMLRESDVGLVPVVDGAERVVGVITDREGVLATFRQSRTVEELTAAQVLKGDLAVCRPDDDLRLAERAMRVAMLTALPVVDGEGKLLGVVSLADVVRNTYGEAEPEVEPEVTEEDPNPALTMVQHVLALLSPLRHARPAAN